MSVTTGSQVTVIQGGATVGSRSLSTSPAYKTTVVTASDTPAVYSSFASVKFDIQTFTLTGGEFTPGNSFIAAGTSFQYTSAANASQFISDVKSDISTAVQQEVSHIGTLVNSVTNAVAAYNATNASETVESATSEARLAMNALQSEVSSTKTTIDSIKSLKFAIPATPYSTLLLEGITYQNYVGSSVISLTGGSSTISSTGVVDFK